MLLPADPQSAAVNFTTPVISTTTTYYAGHPMERVHPVALLQWQQLAQQHRILQLAQQPVVVPDQYLLSASSSATLIWYASASGGTQLGTGSTFTTPFLTTTTTYYVQATNGICPNNYIAVQAIINTSPTISLGPDTIHVLIPPSSILVPGLQRIHGQPLKQLNYYCD